ncbi:MAG TPA: deoxyribonuclease IV [Mollicutes bacterium]|nr:deoxyribonuclease IV [Mollicutes bacterium]
MLIIGSHVSFGKNQLLGCVEETIKYGGNVFMFYTGAPQNTFRSKIDNNLAIEAYKLMNNNNILFDKVICHAPYIINLANNLDPSRYQFSMNFLRSEIDRCISLGVKYLVLHPGSAVKLDREIAIDNIINALNLVLKKEDEIMILLETMAGKGTEIGINLNELKYIIDNINLEEKIGVCIDTCHLNDSGVDLNYFDDYLNNFESLIGLDKLKCVHINDSKNEVGMKKDRHANIGFGTIGFENILKVIYHEKLKNVPKILETPYVDDKPPYKHEIKMIKNKTFNPNLLEDIIKE